MTFSVSVWLATSGVVLERTGMVVRSTEELPAPLSDVYVETGISFSAIISLLYSLAPVVKEARVVFAKTGDVRWPATLAARRKAVLARDMTGSVGRGFGDELMFAWIYDVKELKAPSEEDDCSV